MAALTTTRWTRSGKQRLPGHVALWNVAARVLGIRQDQRACCAGGTANEQVGRELAKLPLGWHVLHAAQIDGSNGIDGGHLVIGPRGVFTLHTTQHRDATVCLYERGLWVNGHSTVYLHNARSEAECVGKLLTSACGEPVEVHAAIVFVGLAELRIKGTPPDVHITGFPWHRDAIERWKRDRQILKSSGVSRPASRRGRPRKSPRPGATNLIPYEPSPYRT